MNFDEGERTSAIDDTMVNESSNGNTTSIFSRTLQPDRTLCENIQTMNASTPIYTNNTRKVVPMQNISNIVIAESLVSH